MKSEKLYYNGQYQEACSGRKFSTINPATGEIICEVQEASAEDLDRAIAAAKSGFAIWSSMAPVERGRILQRAALLLRDQNEALAKLEVMDTGKPLSEAISVDISSAADAVEYYAGIAAAIHGDYYDLGTSFAYTRRQPLGICACIGAWNYPMQIACWKSAPALACGNVVIFKPAQLSPLSALKLAEIYKEAGLPNGVFNVLQGGSELGVLLTKHPDIAKVSLTGEVATGKKVMAASSETLKHLSLELGGKSPILVFEDANIEEAVNGAILGNFYTQGEICSNGTRVYVHERIKTSFLEKLIKKTKQLTIGNPMSYDTQVGALISENHMNKVLHYIEIGKQEGAKLWCGGNRFIPEEASITNGFFVEPTIFEVFDDEAKIAREEIFGPVMSVLSFTEEAAVIRRANDTPFGLAAGVFTNDLKRAHRVVNQLNVGFCWVNNYNITPVEIPFGGFKQSGIGRENGLAAIQHYTQLKTVYIEMDKIEFPYDSLQHPQ